jgi:hypothetical protein
MPISIELRTTCERCKDPLPLNAYSTSVPCWACLHENPMAPEHWAQILRGVLEDAWSMSADEARTETLKVGKRTFELRAAIIEKPRGAARKRPKDMTRDLFPGVVGIADEETEKPVSKENVELKCESCGGMLAIDGLSRQITCTFCRHAFQLSDAVWRRIHPVHAQRAFVLVMEDDGIKVGGAPPEREKKVAQFVAWDAVLGSDGLVYAVISDIERHYVACLGTDLSLKWRSELRNAGVMLRVAIVGDEIWAHDHDKHHVRRFARADGTELGKFGGKEPNNATVHHLDLFGAADIVGCPDRTLLALAAHRLVRYDERGQGILTWPAATGFFSKLWGGEKLRRLYDPTPDDGSGDFDEPHVRLMYQGSRNASDELGSDRPTNVATINQRMVTAVDGSLWISNGTAVFRYTKEGKLAWRADLPHCEGTLSPRPGLDGELALYVCAYDRKERHVLFRVSPDGKPSLLTSEGLGTPNAAFTTPDGRTTVLGAQLGDVRVFDKTGKRLSASGAAVSADREAAEYADDAEDE